MDIQTRENKIGQTIRSTDGGVLRDQIKTLLKGNDENWRNELLPAVKYGINESIAEADKGQFISLDEVKIEGNALFKV